jgi:hypothetical protein
MGADVLKLFLFRRGSVKYIKVASSGAATSNIAALEAGALALRIMKNSS